MTIFEFESYKTFILQYFQKLPKQGYGQLQKLAKAIDVHTSYLSQVFKGDKNLTLEQAQRLCHYLGFTELEEDYFLTLVQLERAGSLSLKKVIQRQVNRLTQESNKISQRISSHKEISHTEKAIFYSEWYYAAISLLTGMPDFKTPEAIAEYLNLPLKLVKNSIQFLLQAGICIEKDGQLFEGKKRTHIPSDSPLVGRHHINWRLKAIENLSQLKSSELAFTCPMSISIEAHERIRSILLESIAKVDEQLVQANEEKLVCLNIDLVEI